MSYRDWCKDCNRHESSSSCEICKPICFAPKRCRCSGMLSEIRRDKDGRPYRHSFSCHSEFYEEESDV